MVCHSPQNTRRSNKKTLKTPKDKKNEKHTPECSRRTKKTQDDFALPEKNRGEKKPMRKDSQECAKESWESPSEGSKVQERS